MPKRKDNPNKFRGTHVTYGDPFTPIREAGDTTTHLEYVTHLDDTNLFGEHYADVIGVHADGTRELVSEVLNSGPSFRVEVQHLTGARLAH